jgi:hypothetical protein
VHARPWIGAHLELERRIGALDHREKQKPHPVSRMGLRDI